MIELKTMNAVCYSKFDTAGVRLQPYTESPLAEVTDTLSVSAVLNTSSTSLPENDDVCKYVSDQVNHTECTESIVTLGVKAVRSLSDLTKNTVNPHIRAVLEQIARRVDDGGGSVDKWSITPNTLAPILNNTVTHGLVSPLRGSVKSDPNTDGKSIGNFNAEYIRSVAKLLRGDGFEEMIESALAEDQSELMHFTQQFLLGRVIIRENTSPEQLVIPLVVATATRTPPAGVEVSLATWELNRATLINVLSHAIIRKIDAYELQITQGLLYSTARLQSKGDILVNDRVYRTMIDKGLTPEIVIGNEILGRKYLTFQLLSEGAMKECTAAYNVNRSADEQARKLNEKTYRISAIQDTLRNDLNRIAEQESWPVDGDSREKAWGRLKTITEKVLTGPHKDNPTEDVVAAIILGTWYAHTDAWRLMDIATRIAKEDPELQSSELFALAKIEYVAKWLASQIHVVGDINDADEEVIVSNVETAVS